MKRRSNWIKCVVAVSLCLTVVSCSRVTESSQEQKFVDNFNALVMGGKTIDSHQDWSTVGNASVKVSVDYDNDKAYTVYISTTPLILDANAAYIGMAKLASGESKTISIARPANTPLLYAACYDEQGHAVSKPFVIGEGETEVAFSGKSPSETASYSPTLDNRWSVPARVMPDLSDYTTGKLIDPRNLEEKIDYEGEVHYIVSSDFLGFIPSLSTFDKKSVYVTATWTLSFNQRVSRNNVLIVGEGGRLVVPDGFRLTSAPLADEECGLIYVLPGGEIVGDGEVEFSTNEGTFCYNAGTITCLNVRMNGGTLYNSGTIGATGASSTALVCSANDRASSLFVNAGVANLTAIIGDELSIDNAGYLKINGGLTLNGTSRMDDGSYTECTSLTLNGDASGGKVLYMGNAAYMNCLGDVSIDNFGVQGPADANFKANAIFKVNRCTNCVTTEGVADTYLLDHVELILPSTFPTIFNNGAINAWDSDKRVMGVGKLLESFSGYQNLRMLYYWFNGYEGKLLDAGNYLVSQDGGKYALVWNGSAATGVESSRQTCTYSTSPSYNHAGHATFNSAETGSTPAIGCVFYLFETLESSTKDFDYNDVVLRVNTPIDNGDGTFLTSVQVMCVGNTVKTTVLYDGAPFGDEVHSAIGTAVTSPINVTSVSRLFRKLDDIIFTNGGFRTDALGFSLSVEDENGTVTTESQPALQGEAPLYIVVNGNPSGKFFWPSEGNNIGVAYPQFSNWAANTQTAIDWYDSSNATSSKIVSY